MILKTFTYVNVMYVIYVNVQNSNAKQKLEDLTDFPNNLPTFRRLTLPRVTFTLPFHHRARTPMGSFPSVMYIPQGP